MATGVSECARQSWVSLLTFSFLQTKTEDRKVRYCQVLWPKPKIRNASRMFVVNKLSMYCHLLRYSFIKLLCSFGNVYFSPAY